MSRYLTPELCVEAMHRLGRKTIDDYDELFAKKKRLQSIVDLKCVCINYILENFDIPFTKLGAMVGLTNHTTIIHHKNKYECQKCYPDFQHLITTYRAEVEVMVFHADVQRIPLPEARRIKRKELQNRLRDAIEIGFFNHRKPKKHELLLS